MKPFHFSGHAARLATVVAVCSALGACSQHAGNTWQGYVEGEFVYLGSTQSGKLTQLQVARGDQVNADAPVFALESVDETAALQQAQQQLAAAR
ncbi:MAG TPA: biotin/lipoyl-binding protein, partial [Paraburkholderia sp.]|nr:biotin/lipoyl-binding protein [Paraburkholderia sp.]